MPVTTMAEPSSALGNESLSTLWRAACDEYGETSGIALTDEKFPKICSAEDLSCQLDKERDYFEDFRMKKRSLFRGMQMVLMPFEHWGDLVTGAVSTTFPAASSIMGVMLLLVRGARKVSESFDMLTDLFHRLGHFALRLESYKGVPLSEGIKTIIVKVLINLLNVFAASQKLLSRGSLRVRFSKWSKNLFFDDTSVSSLLAELEELTNQEHRMVSAHGLDLTHQTMKNTVELLQRDDGRKSRERLNAVRGALKPVSASGQVFSAISESRIPGSGTWVEDRIQSWWHSSEPLLWIHGGPGVGKSYLASKIIDDLAKTEVTAISAPIVASFFCKNNDVDLRSCNQALRALAWQMAVQLPSFAEHVEEFCLREDPANSYVVWQKLLLDYLIESPPNISACFIIDGVDEADAEEQEILFSLLEKAFSSEDPTSQGAQLRIVLLSRDSVRSLFEEHCLEWIQEIEVTGAQNGDDLHRYVSDKIQKAKLFRSSPDLGNEIIHSICGQAEGLWEWANIVIKSVLRCRTKEQIRKVVSTMPRGISAMLQKELQRLERELSIAEPSDGEQSDDWTTASQMQQLSILLSFVTIAQKPLSVVQLELILEILLEEEILNLEEDLRTVYSSLFSLRSAKEGDNQTHGQDIAIITLRHSSFYEFFRTSVVAGRIHVDPDQTEATFLFVLLEALRNHFAPKSDRGLGPVRRYAQDFLPTHLMRAKPADSVQIRGKISNLLTDLFTEETKFKDWVLREYHATPFTRYVFYPGSDTTELARYWWNCDDYQAANERAELVLAWLLPDKKKALEDRVQTPAVAYDASAFSVLFYSMAASFARLWLAPDEINKHDGLPEILPAMLSVYAALTGAKGQRSNDKAPEPARPPEYKESLLRMTMEPSEILLTAESQGLPKSPIWHARVAQAQLLQGHYVEALEHFQITLNDHQQSPSLSTQSLSSIYRDMARANKETGKYKEALKQFELAKSLNSTFEESDDWDGQIAHLLNAAQTQNFANLADQAAATADEAWKLFADRRKDLGSHFFISFFSLYLEMQLPHRLRNVWNLALIHFKEIAPENPQYFVEFITDWIVHYDHTSYRVLHYALMQSDAEYLDLIASIPKQLMDPIWRDIPRSSSARYFLGSFLFGKGRLDAGIRTWYDAVSYRDTTGCLNADSVRTSSLGRLAAVCLYRPELSIPGGSTLKLNDDDELGDICLIFANWLRDQGDTANSRKMLCRRVKKCIQLLSVDDPSNDLDAYIMLFKTLLVATESDEDLGAALYSIKNFYIQRDGEVRDGEEKEVKPMAEDISESTNQLSLLDDQIEGPEEKRMKDVMWFLYNDVTECSYCKLEIITIYEWYYSRSCPFMMLCPRCYMDTQSTDPTAGLLPCDICHTQHEFYYTGPHLQPSERVPHGMVPLVSSNGRKQIIWIEEWKEKLAAKWETTDLELQGEWSSWCMSILPEPQRTRWRTLFKI